MICLADNDIILKLASCDLLLESMTAIGSTWDEVYVIPSAVHKLINPKRPGKGRVKPSEPEYDRLRIFFQSVRVLDEQTNTEEQATFKEIQEIDSGEAILFSATAAHTDFRLVTNDKRCLEAVSNYRDEICVRVRERMRGRVICFEQIVRKTIIRFGFEFVLGRVIPALYCDRALGIVFAAGNQCVRTEVFNGLDSYIGDLRRKTGDLLEPDDPFESNSLQSQP